MDTTPLVEMFLDKGKQTKIAQSIAVKARRNGEHEMRRSPIRAVTTEEKATERAREIRKEKAETKMNERTGKEGEERS